MSLKITEHILLWLPPFAYALVYVPLNRAILSRPAASAFVLRFQKLHNWLMAGFSLVMTVLAVQHLALYRPGFTPHDQLCATPRPAPLMVKAWYVSKFAEWIDSTLLIAQGKPLSSLHWNHHATTATVVGSHFVGRPVRTSIFDWPLLLNAGVHTLMYSYYAAPKALRPLRKLITTSQIIQHVTVLGTILYTSGTRLLGGSCDVSDGANGLSLLLYGMYLVQFLAFYVSAYLKRPVTATAPGMKQMTANGNGKNGKNGNGKKHD